MGKYNIIKSSSGKYYFVLRAPNAETILIGELYDNYDSAKSAAEEAMAQSGQDDAYRRNESIDGKVFFQLLGRKGAVLGSSKLFASNASLKRGIDSVRKYGGINVSTVVDALDSLKLVQKIGSVRTFITAIESLPQDAESVIFFRGHGDASYKLVPSLYRNPGWVRNEHVIFQELLLRCPGDFHMSGPTFNILVKMQHYSLPTRLLDITANPLISLYFACIGGGVADAEVVAFSIPKNEIRYYDSDRVSLISNIGRLPGHTRFPKNIENNKFNSNDDVVRLVREVQREKPYFEARIDPVDISSVVCVKPVLDNPRIIKQDGAFLLFGVDGEKGSPASVPDKYLLTNKDFKIIVRGSDKTKVLEQLESLGITKSTIYPEIEHVAGYLRDRYRDK